MEKRNHNRNSSRPNPDKDWLKYSGIAFEMAAFNLLVIWGGYKLDKMLENHIPWFLILALLLCVVGTLYFTFKKLN
ncbi:MAG: AtpZ/AtpI family protein [Cyclobacteriaceae bacterium]